MPRWLLAWASAIGWTAASCWPAAADQQDARLAGLFEQLRATRNAAEARSVEQRIWHIWIETDDDAINGLMNQGIEALSRQEYALALERFDRIVRQAPEFAEGWNKRATVHYLTGNYRASVLDIRRTLDLEPRHFGALSGLGLIYDAIERPGAALRSFEAALEINPHLATTRERIEELRRELEGSRT